MYINSKYKIIQTLHEGDSTLVYRAIRIADNQKVILKTLKPSHTDEINLEHFLNGQKALSMLSSKNIIKLYEVIISSLKYIHVLQDINGSSLYDLISVHKFKIDEILHIALEIANTMQYIHDKHIIHADINPKNIIYNPETKAVQIIDFGNAIIEESSQFGDKTDKAAAGTLSYMSPEQTGVTQKTIDYRSDFYSFGLTLYHLFLGQSPFEAEDEHEMIHKQIAFSPKSLNKVNKSIPAVISNIVEKLIQKSRDQRYQSDEAIIDDLKQCLEQLSASGKISDFPLAVKDKPTVKIGEHLFGREKELAILKEASEKVVDSQSIKVLISGHSGVGKTRLTEEFLSFFDPEKFNIIRGKADQYKVLAPYLIFQDLLRKLATLMSAQEKNHEFDTLSNHNIEVLCQVFPLLKTLFLCKKRPTALSRESIVNTLPTAINYLYDLATAHTHPLIIFIDDLQWADPASIVLLKKTMLDIRNPNISLVLGYRDNEIKDNKNAYDLILSFENQSTQNLYKLKINPLKRNDLRHILQELRFVAENDGDALTSLLHKKTAGNPLYVKAFIEYIIDTDALSFNQGKWQASLEKITKYELGLNIVEIINSKFNKLSSKEQLYLQNLSLLGSSFDLDLTYRLMSSLGFSRDHMSSVVRKGFIEYGEQKYHFVHDRIHANIHNSVTKELSLKINLQIGRYLETMLKNRGYSDLITVVNHLNNAYGKGKFPKRLFNLNLNALDEMLIKNSYLLALESIGWIETNLMSDLRLSEQRKKSFRYKVLRIKVLYLNALHEEANKEINFLIKNTQDIKQKIICFSLFKNICVTRGKSFKELIEFGNQIFTQLSLQVPVEKEELEGCVEKLDKEIIAHPLFKDPYKIVDLPALHKGEKKIIMSLLVDYWEGAYYLADIALMKWSYLTIIDYSLRYGNSGESAFGYVLYGANLVSKNSYKKGFIFGDIALKINALFKDKAILPKIHNFVANFINPYTRSLASNKLLYKKSLYQSKINGDIIFGTWANFLMHFSDYLSGNDLPDLQKNISNESDFILASGDTKMIAIFNILRETVNGLQGISTRYNQNEDALLKMFKKDQFYPALSWYGILKAQNCFLNGSFDEGLSYLKNYIHNERNEVIMFPKIRLHFIRSLLLLATNSSITEPQHELLVSDLNEFRTYAKESPRNFKFEKLLLEAEEMKRVKSQWDTAKKYDAAIKEAYRQNNHFFMALGGLCSSHFWEYLNHHEMSNFYCSQAIVSLNQWGAYEAAEQVKSRTPHEKQKSRQNLLSSSQLEIESFDFQSIIKSFHTISQSMNSKSLIKGLMKIILQNATASKAVLIFKDEDSLFVKATADFNNKKIDIRTFLLDEYELIPKNLIFYAINRGEDLVLQNPAESTEFQADNYLKSVKPASSIVIPTIIEGGVKGVIYLENTEVATPVSQENIKTLKFLLTQAFTVFKTTSLDEKVKKTSEELEILRERLEYAINGTNDGLWDWNLLNNEVYFSPKWKSMLGYRDEELQNVLSTWEDRIHPDDIEQTKENILQSHQAPGILYENIHRLRHKDGHWIWVLDRGQTIFDEDLKAVRMVCFHTDITQRKELENELKREVYDKTERLKETALLYSLSESIQKQQSIDELLQGTASLAPSGWQYPEATRCAITFDDKRYVSKAFDESEWKQSQELVVNGKPRGKIEVYYMTDYPTLYEGPFMLEERNMLNNICHQISKAIEYKEVEAELKDKENIMLAQSQHAAMGEMIGMIAHQWRQPLSVMSMAVNNLKVDLALGVEITNEVLDEMGDDILNQTQYLSKTIDDFRNFFRPKKGVDETKLENIMAEVQSIMGKSLENNGVTLSIKCDDSFTMKTYSRELMQVYINLIKNAKEALIENRNENRRINVLISKNTEYAITTVCDNGGGVPEDIILKIFDPYFTTKDEKNGTGLGLYMSKTIIEKHLHGILEVSNSDEGACFKVSLPLEWISSEQV